MRIIKGIEIIEENMKTHPEAFVDLHGDADPDNQSKAGIKSVV